jgi:hypothetical protein
VGVPRPPYAVTVCPALSTTDEEFPGLPVVNAATVTAAVGAIAVKFDQY